MEHLRNLYLIDETRLNSTPFLDHAILPSLESFEYSNNWRADTKRVLSSLRAPERLTRLGLSSRVSTEDLAESLRLFPMLDRLILHQPWESPQNNGAVSCALFTLLCSASGATETLCPQLREILFLGFNAGSDEELLALIETRRANTIGTHPLSRIHICFPRERQMDILGELAVLESGLAVTLRYPTKDQLQFIRGKDMWRSTLPLGIRGRPEIPVERDPTTDWGPLSNQWIADYAEWGSDLSR